MHVMSAGKYAWCPLLLRVMQIATSFRKLSTRLRLFARKRHQIVVGIEVRNGHSVKSPGGCEGSTAGAFARWITNDGRPGGE